MEVILNRDAFLKGLQMVQNIVEPRQTLPILANVAFADPELFDAIVLMHPLIPFEPAKAGLSGKRVLVTAGRRDPICPTVLTTRLIAQLQERDAAVTVEWHEGGHELRENEIEAARRFLVAAAAQGEAA